jgi:hypothetical protein
MEQRRVICGIFLLALLLMAPVLSDWRRLPMDARARMRRAGLRPYRAGQRITSFWGRPAGHWPFVFTG